MKVTAVRRLLVSLVSVAAIVTGDLLSAAVSSAAPSSPLRAGYVAKINPQRTVRVTVIAPTLTCRPPGRRAVTVGAFGTLTATYQHKITRHVWAVTVRTVCKDGSKVSRARFDNHLNSRASIGVSPGDRVRLAVTQGMSFTLADQTTGVGEGGVGPLPAGEKIVAHARVFFGAQLSGPNLPTPPVRVLRARVGHESLAALQSTARVARHGKRVVARPTQIRTKSGGFSIVHVRARP